MNKFAWGKVIKRFEYDLDGKVMRIVKYHPWKTDGATILTGKHDETKTCYFSDDLHEHSDSIYELLISFGFRNSLVFGVVR